MAHEHRLVRVEQDIARFADEFRGLVAEYGLDGFGYVAVFGLRQGESAVDMTVRRCYASVNGAFAFAREARIGM
jgi:hypothetical protein